MEMANKKFLKVFYYTIKKIISNFLQKVNYKIKIYNYVSVAFTSDYKSVKDNPAEPCYYNSSIYYGGQESYSPTTNSPPQNVSLLFICKISRIGNFIIFENSW